MFFTKRTFINTTIYMLWRNLFFNQGKRTFIFLFLCGIAITQSTQGSRKGLLNK